MRFRAPASSANLGPGFDALAVALSLHVEVQVEPAGCLELTAVGEGHALAADPADHLAVRVVRDVAGHDRFAIHIDSRIPVGRGLGSSAALVAATAAAVGSTDPFSVAARFDGHPENAAASVLGGLVGATTTRNGPVARRLALDPRISFVVVVPERTLPTEEARAALPEEVPLRHAAANLGHLALLIAGLADLDQLVPGATDDRLHQSARSALFPEAARLMEILESAGARAAAWSGAGPSMIGICDSSTADGVRDRVEEAMAATGVAGSVLELAADTQGLLRL